MVQLGQLSADDLTAARQNLDAAEFNVTTAQRNQTQSSFDGFGSILRQFNEVRKLLEDVEKAVSRTAPTPAAVTPTTVHRVEISMDGTKRTLNKASVNDAQTLTGLLEMIGEASRRTGCEPLGGHRWISGTVRADGHDQQAGRCHPSDPPTPGDECRARLSLTRGARCSRR